MPTVVLQVLPFFLIVGLGFAARWFKALDERAAEGLSAYVFWIGFPALLIDALARAPIAQAGFVRGLVAYGAVMVGVLVATVLIGRALRWPERTRAGAGLAAGVGNTAFLGLPLAVAVLGEAARAPAAALVAVDFVGVLSIGVVLVASAGGRPLHKAVAHVAANPVILGAATGLALAWTHLVLPTAVAKPIAILAQTGSPVALVALGAVLAAPNPGGAKSPLTPIVMASALKLFAAPALVFAAATAVGAPDEVRKVAVLLAACPTAVNVFIQTRAYGVYADGAAKIVAVTTAVSCVSLTVLASWLG